MPIQKVKGGYKILGRVEVYKRKKDAEAEAAKLTHYMRNRKKKKNR